MSQDKKMQSLQGHGSSHSLCLWLGERRVQLGCLIGKGKRAEWQKLADINLCNDKHDPVTLSDLCATLHRLLPETEIDNSTGLDLRVVIADRWLAIACIPWSDLMTDPMTANTFARDYLNQLGFEVSLTDTIRMDDTAFGKARWVVAYPAALLESISLCAKNWHALCRTIRPQSVLAWTKLSRNKVEAMALVGEDSVTLGIVETKSGWGRPRLQEINLVVNVAENTPGQLLQSAWQRWCLRQPLTQDVKKVHVLDATDQSTLRSPEQSPFLPAQEPWYRLYANPQWLDALVGKNALDAVSLGQRSSFWLWPLLAVGVATVSLLAVDAWTQWKQIQHAQNVFEARNIIKPPPRPVSWTSAEKDRLIAVNAAIRQLNMPVGTLLHGLHPPSDISVAVLSVETSLQNTDNATNILKIKAEALTSHDMTRYVAFISESEPFLQAYLINHKIHDVPSPRLRFVVEAQWSN